MLSRFYFDYNFQAGGYIYAVDVCEDDSGVPDQILAGFYVNSQKVAFTIVELQLNPGMVTLVPNQ